MADGYDGREFVPILRAQLPENATVLELGMGPGKDLLLLSKYFHVTGSDNSQIFLDLFQASHPKADLLWLDATSIDTSKKFDCIYSNKVLHHLAKAQLEDSFRIQAEKLNQGGIVFHTFWYGDTEEEHSGLRFVYYTPENLLSVIDGGFEVVTVNMYAEMADNDSFYILLRKNR